MISANFTSGGIRNIRFKNRKSSTTETTKIRELHQEVREMQYIIFFTQGVLRTLW